MLVLNPCIQLQEELWTTDLHMISMIERLSPNDSTWVYMSEAARQLEMFLDYVGALTCSSSMYLLNPSYEHMLSKEDKVCVCSLLV